MTAGVRITEDQLRDAENAFDVSVLNGIVSLAAMLRGKGVLDDQQIQLLHEQMTKPLELPERANNPGVQLVQSVIDQMFVGLLPSRG